MITKKSQWVHALNAHTGLWWQVYIFFISNDLRVFSNSSRYVVKKFWNGWEKGNFRQELRLRIGQFMEANPNLRTSTTIEYFQIESIKKYGVLNR